MRILQILPELNVGGVETGTVDFANYLVENGHKSVVISNGGRLVAKLEEEGSRHYALPVHKKSLPTAWRMIEKVRAIINKEKIQIVHARSRVPAWIAYFACRKTRAMFITTCHGFYRHPWYSQVMGWSKLVIVPSEAIARHMIDTYHVPAERIRCIPRSVDMSRFEGIKRRKRKDGSFVVTILGRLTPLKGHPYFLQAMARVMRQVPHVKIWVIGDAPQKKPEYREELEKQATRLGLRNNIEFLGNRADVPQLLSRSDVLCFASTEPESFGRAIVEAQAAHVPVVATKVGGVLDIIEDGRTGYLVLPKDAAAMADKVLHIYQHPKEVRKITEAAYAKVLEHYTIDQMAGSTIKVYKEMLRMVNILVLKISSIGDVVLVTASLKALRQKYPRAKIYCLVGSESRKILSNCPYLDGIIVYDHRGKERGYWPLWKLSRKLRGYRFDRAIDFQNNRKSHLLAFLSMARETYGFDNGKWSGLLTDPVPNDNPDLPAVQHQFQVLQQLQIEYDPELRLELWPTKQDRQYVDAFFDEEWLGNARNIVGINVAASPKWQTKNWPPDYIVELCDKLAAKNVRVILTGAEGDRELAKYIHEKAKSKPTISAGKTDILQLAALIARCKVYVTPDSAPLHVAAAIDTPVIALFGPTDSRRHVPPAQQLAVYQRKLPCAPCYSGQCKIRTHDCMREIKPDHIFKKVMALIS